MKVHVDPDDIKKVQTDSRGRAYLGTDLTDRTVTIAVLEEETEEADQ